MTWYRYETGPWWRYTRGMTDAEKGAFADRMNEALEDRRTGVNPIADELLREAEAFSEKRRNAANRRWKGRKEPDASACKCMQVHSIALPDVRTYVPTDERTVQPDRPSDARARAAETPRTDGRTDRDLPGMENPGNPANPAGRPADAPAARPAPTAAPEAERPATAPPRPASLPPDATTADRERKWAELAVTLEDPYALISAIPDIDLPPFAAWACYEAGNHRAVARYRRFCRERGFDAFRRELETFIGDCHAGGEPDSRGRAFMNRITTAGKGA